MKGGADINARNNSNQTALYVAINTGRKEIAKWLIEKGADVNAKDEDGKTALNYANGIRVEDFLVKLELGE